MISSAMLKLYFGESSLPTPDYIKRAAQKAMADGFTFYTENAGIPSLRKALVRYSQELHGVTLDPASEIVVTASGVQALNLGLRCVLDPGDQAPRGEIALGRDVVPRERLVGRGRDLAELRRSKGAVGVGRRRAGLLDGGAANRGPGRQVVSAQRGQALAEVGVADAE